MTSRALDYFLTRFTLLFYASCRITQRMQSYYTQTTGVVTKTSVEMSRMGVDI
jgi:hypothetical protein